MSRRTRGAARRLVVTSERHPACEPLEERRPFSTLAVLTKDERLLTIDSTNTRAIVSNQPITGLQAGEKLVGIDVRPATGELYALSAAGRLYTIDARTGAATMKA